MSKAILLSNASTYTVFAGSGTYHGLTARRVAGGTVVIADLANAGATPLNLNAAASISGAKVVMGPAAANAQSTFISGHAMRMSAGLTIAFSSTTNATVHYDD